MKRKYYKLSIALLLAFLLLFSLGCEVADPLDQNNNASETEVQSIFEPNDPNNEADNEEYETESLSEGCESSGQSEQSNVESSESEVKTEATGTEKPDVGDIIDTSGYAQSLEDALDRASKGQVSGSTVTPDQTPVRSEYMPMIDGKYVKNNDPYYIDENTYVVVDAYGREF